MSTDILITGAAGFIGKLVLRALSARQSLTVEGQTRAIGRILAVDLTTSTLGDLAAADPRILRINGSLSDAAVLDRIAGAEPGVIVHLAAVVSSAAEADFQLGIDVNLNATLDLIHVCRRFSLPPVMIFSSSVAVFSCASNDTIDDDTPPSPLSSYGTQKLMGELLIRDASRKGFIKGRSLRFPTVSVRPGKPNAAASSFASGIIREPLAGQEAVLPVGPDLRLHLASPARACDSVLTAIALGQERLTGETTITLPGVSVTVGEMLKTLRAFGGETAADLVVPRADPDVERIVRSWPGEIRAPRAQAIGFRPDESFDEIVALHMGAKASEEAV